MCLACGDATQVGSEEHRLVHCVAWRLEKIKCLSQATRAWLDSDTGRSFIGALVRGPLPLDGMFLGPEIHEQTAAREHQGMSADVAGRSYNLIPRETAGEAEDMAVAMLARRFVKGPTPRANGVWEGRSRALIWREVWSVFPQGLRVLKVKAHRTTAECGGDPWELFLNEAADHWANVASASHAGGLAQIQWGCRLGGMVQEVFKRWARQGELLATKQMVDHVPLEEVQQRDKPRVGRPRGRRSCWLALEWLKALAAQAEPRLQQGGVRGVPGAQGIAMPLARLAERHVSHSWRVHRIVNDEEDVIGSLASCEECGCYTQARAHLAVLECRGGGEVSRGLRRQLARIGRGLHGLHPQAGMDALW
eukprot:2986191-Amphidinium_carterae.1